MNCAVIFAGGTGQRMNSKTKPKQFLELHGKPILIYTLEQFENTPEIDAIVVVSLDSWIPYLQNLLQKYQIKKVVSVVPGGKTGQQSICNGVTKLYELYGEDAIVLVHDGVRPLVDSDTIQRNIECVKSNGNAITVTSTVETIVIKDADDKIGRIVDRSRCELARAPQGFMLGELYHTHQKAISEGMTNFIDSACLMNHYGYKLHSIVGPSENIKITTPEDFYIFRAIMDARENSQIYGL